MFDPRAVLFRWLTSDDAEWIFHRFMAVEELDWIGGDDDVFVVDDEDDVVDDDADADADVDGESDDDHRDVDFVQIIVD